MSNHVISTLATPASYPTLVVSRFHEMHLIGTTMLKQALVSLAFRTTMASAIRWLDQQPIGSVEVFLLGSEIGITTEGRGNARIEGPAIRDQLRRHPAVHPTACFILWSSMSDVTSDAWLQEHGFHAAMPHTPSDVHLGDAVVALREKLSAGTG